MQDHTSHIRHITIAFLEKLKEQRFFIGIEAYVDALRAVEYFLKQKPNFKLEDLGNYLAPIVCKSEESQIAFYGLFNIEVIQPYQKYLREFREIKDKKDEKTRLVRKWIKYTLGLTISAVFCWGIYLYIIPFCNKKPYPKPNPDEIFEYAGPQFYKKGDSTTGIIFANPFRYYPDRSKDFKIEAYMSGCIDTIRQFDKFFTLNNIGRQRLTVNISSKKHDIDTTIIKNDIFVGHKFSAQIQTEHDTAYIGDENNYKIIFKDSLNAPFTWYVGDSTNHSWDNQKSIRFKFTKSDRHNISIKYNLVSDTFLAKFPEDFYSVSTTQLVLNMGIRSKIYSKPVAPKYDNQVNIYWVIALGLLILACVLLLIHIRKKIKDFKKEYLTSKTSEADPIDGRDPPYEIPFKTKEHHIVKTTELGKLAAELRKTTEGPIPKLHISGTINQTIRNGGLVSPVWQNQKAKVYYLFLVEREYANSQVFKVFAYLLRNFLKQSSQIDFYFYHQFPERFYQTGQDKGLSLLQLADLHHNAHLFVVSTGYTLLEFYKPRIKKEYADSFSASWQSRILITPVPFKDWSHNEKYLSSFFSLVPADVVGLLEIIKLLEKGQNTTNLFTQIQLGTYEAKYIDFNQLESLENYLDKDEDLIQWICALAIYPKINWEVSIEIGKNVLGDFAHKINYENLLKLARIKWMHEGKFTTQIRLMLLKRLSVENELKARATLLKLLDEAELDESAFSYEEKLVNKYMSSFILNSTTEQNKDIYKPIYNKPDEINKYAKRFASLYTTGQFLDVAFKIYVENEQSENDHWKTPIVFENKQVSAKEYLKLKKETEKIVRNKKTSMWKTLIYILIFFVASIATILISTYLYTEKIAPTKINQILNIIKRNPIPPDIWKISLVKNECYKHALIKSKAQIIALKDDGNIQSFGGSLDSLFHFSLNRKGIDGGLQNHSNVDFIITDSTQNKKYFTTISMFGDNEYFVELEVEGCMPKIYLDTVIIEYSELFQKEAANDLKKHLEGLNYFVAELKGTSILSVNQINYGLSSKAKAARILQKEVESFFKATPNVSFEVINDVNSVNSIPKGKYSFLKVFIKDVNYVHSSSKDTVYIQYCSKDIKSEVEGFRRQLNNGNNFYCPAIDLVENNCDNEVRYYTVEDASKADELAATAGVYFNQIINAVKSTVHLSRNKKRNIELWVNWPNRILWLDDHPENNPEIEYFRSKGIAVDIAVANSTALEYLNLHTYSLIITDIGRNEEEHWVIDKEKAGVEFVSMVNFPKEYIIICSPKTTIERNKEELLALGILNSNLNSDKQLLKEIVVSNLNKWNHKSYYQSLCWSGKKVSLPSDYTIYFDKNKIALNSLSKKVLDELVSDLKQHPEYSLTLNCYSSNGTLNYSFQKGERYGTAVINYLKSSQVNTEHFLIKSYAKGNVQNKCTERVEIFIQDFGDSDAHQSDMDTSVQKIFTVDIFSVGNKPTDYQNKVSHGIYEVLKDSKEFRPRTKIFKDSSNAKLGFSITDNQIRYDESEKVDAEKLQKLIYERTGLQLRLRKVQYTESKGYLSVFIASEN